jgi:hypothetical protein
VSLEELLDFENAFPGEVLHPGFKSSLGSLKSHIGESRCGI